MMMNWRFGLAMGIALTSGVSAQAATKQEIYNAAQAAFDKGDWTAASTGFEQVAGDPNGKQNHSQAVIRARLADAYYNQGLSRRAAASARLAISGLDRNDPVELAGAWQTLGDTLRFDLNMSEAAAAYRQALDISPAADIGARFRARVGLAHTMMVADPAAAAQMMDDILNDKTIPPASLKPNLATFEDLRARAALNMGDLSNAAKFIQQALSHSGGLSGDKVSLQQVALRGDAAIIYRLLHNDEKTREYLTYTGAGHLKAENWSVGGDEALPVCGDATGLRPDDTAVVEFAVDARGRVAGATPIYASRPGDAALEFARAVRKWRWTTEALTTLDPFWRASLRIQMRCVNRPVPAQIEDQFWNATQSWLIGKGVSEADADPSANGVITASDPRLAKDDVSAVATMLAYMQFSARANATFAPRLEKILNAADAPADTRALALLPYVGSDTIEGRARSRAAAFAGLVDPFAAKWPGSRAAIWLRLEYANALEGAHNFVAAQPQYEAVLAAPLGVVGPSDQIRQFAVLHLAALRKSAGDAVSADAIIRQSGITADQCSQFDVRPVATNAAISSSAFPAEAMRWRFEGFARESFDIAADGSVINVRTVLAYPPFIFEQATERAVARFRYLPPVIDGAPAGCSGQSQAVHYQIQR